MTAGPPLLVWEVIRDCPLDCIYCYNVWKGPGTLRHSPTGQADPMEVAGAVAGAGPSAVTLTGGEPLLVRELADIASLLAGRGTLVGVATSGVTLDLHSAEKLVRSGVRRFEVSLPAADAAGYLRLTKRDGFTAAKTAMMAVIASGAKLTVSHVITALNPEGAANVIELAFALGAEAVALNRFVPGGEGLRNRGSLELSTEVLHNALTVANQAAGRFPVPVFLTIPVENCLLPHAGYPHLRFTGCVCGRDKWAVDPWGRLRVCEQSPDILGSLLDKPFAELASQSAVELFRADLRSPECASCQTLPVCGGGCRFARV